MIDEKEKTLRDFVHEAIVPLIEDVIVKKLYQALEVVASEIKSPRKEWVGLTVEEVNEIRKDIFQKYQKALLVTRDVTSENDYSAFNFYRAIEDKLRSKND
jgi:hypothetical protein